MKLLLLLINLAFLPMLAKTCNQGAPVADIKNDTDTLSMLRDTVPSSIDTTATMMNGQPASSVDTKADTLSKDTKYGTANEKKEAPKHDSPNQEKVDSIKAANKKKKKD